LGERKMVETVDAGLTSKEPVVTRRSEAGLARYRGRMTGTLVKLEQHDKQNLLDKDGCTERTAPHVARRRDSMLRKKKQRTAVKVKRRPGRPSEDEEELARLNARVVRLTFVYLPAVCYHPSRICVTFEFLHGKGH